MSGSMMDLDPGERSRSSVIRRPRQSSDYEVLIVHFFFEEVHTSYGTGDMT